jgi:hypothetical protein
MAHRHDLRLLATGHAERCSHARGRQVMEMRSIQSQDGLGSTVYIQYVDEAEGGDAEVHIFRPADRLPPAGITS